MREREASDLLVVGRVLSPWGVKGQVKVEVMTDSPQRLAPQNRVYLDGRPLVIEDTRRLKGYLVLKLDTIDSVEAAERLRGRYLEAPRPDTSALLPGEYYHFQLIGLEVWSLEGELLGRISDILARSGVLRAVVRETTACSERLVQIDDFGTFERKHHV